MGQRKSGRAVLALVLGILSFVGFGPITGIAAWIIGNSVLNDIRNGTEDPGEAGLAQAGKVLGMIATILTILGFCLFLMFTGAFFGLAASQSGH